MAELNEEVYMNKIEKFLDEHRAIARNKLHGAEKNQFLYRVSFLWSTHWLSTHEFAIPQTKRLMERRKVPGPWRDELGADGQPIDVNNEARRKLIEEGVLAIMKKKQLLQVTKLQNKSLYDQLKYRTTLKANVGLTLSDIKGAGGYMQQMEQSGGLLPLPKLGSFPEGRHQELMLSWEKKRAEKRGVVTAEPSRKSRRKKERRRARRKARPA